MQKIYPCVWIGQKDGGADEALKYYKDIFKDNLKVVSNYKYSDKNVLPEFLHEFAEKTMIIEVEIFGNRIMLLNAGDDFMQKSGFISLIILTEDQEETDYYWNAISKTGAESQCGWCIDRFGINWQVTPKAWIELMSKGTQEEKDYANTKLFEMKNIIIKDLYKN